MAGTCRDCKHWGGLFGEPLDPAGFGACQKIKRVTVTGPVAAIARINPTTDDEHYPTSLETRAEFGCALFEKAERKP